MSAKITELLITDTGLYATATCGKVGATVCITDYDVRVTCHNASHRVWRGVGRSFPSVSEALAAYKKPEMKAIILAVDARNS